MSWQNNSSSPLEEFPSSPITPYLRWILELYKQEKLLKWKNPLKLDKRTIDRLLEWTGTIVYKTALLWKEKINTYTHEEKELFDYFIISELKGTERDREIVVEYADRENSKDEWISIVHYVFTKKFKGFGIADILWFLLVLGIILTCITAYFSS